MTNMIETSSEKKHTRYNIISGCIIHMYIGDTTIIKYPVVYCVNYYIILLLCNQLEMFVLEIGGDFKWSALLSFFNAKQ